MAEMAALVVPGEVFGPPSEAALEQSHKARELTYAVQQTGWSLATGGWGRSTLSMQGLASTQHTSTQSSSANLSQGSHHSFHQQQPTKQAYM